MTSAFVACVCLSAVLTVAHAQAPQGITIQAGDLNAALESLVEKTGIQLLYDVKQIAGLRTQGVNDAQSPQAAVTALLKGTSLTIRTDASGAILIAAPDTVRSTDLPVSHNSGTSLRFAEADPENRNEGNPSEVPPDSDDRSKLEEIVVTGSRLQRLKGAGPSPVVVVTREEIERSGAATTREVLSTITQNAVARDESGNSTFLGASTIQLRGLPFGTTLLLLNGRRLGASAAQVSPNLFDINNIPLEAVERIEVLTDTASAVYGADAIGGAVNIILRQDFKGVGAAVRLGTSAEGDATERSASLTLGGAGEALSGLLVLDVFDRDPVRAADRDLTRTFDFTRFGGPDARSTSPYPANVFSLDFDPVTGAALPLPGLTSPFAAVPSGTDGVGLTPADFAATDGTLRVFDPAPYATLVAETNRKSVFASGRYTVSPALKLFGEALHTHRDQVVQFPPDFTDFGEFGVVVVPAQNPFNPFGVPVGVNYRFLEVGPTANDSTTNFSRFVVGAEGGFLERFDWQVYLLTDREHTDILNSGVVDDAAVQEALNSTDPQTALNVFSTTGNNSPALLAGISGETTDDLTTKAHMGEAVVRGPLLDLPGGPLRAAVGINVRREKVDFRSPLAGNFLFDRDSEAAFAEVSVPLVGANQNIPAVDSLELTAAVRHDRYDDADSVSSTNPQFGLAWRPTQTLLVRGSYGEAFKAPTVFNLFFPPLTFTGAAFDPLRGGQFGFFQVAFGGNPALLPEEGESMTAGLVWEPRSVPGFSLSVNAFRLKQTNFITTLDINTLIANPDLFPGRVVRGTPAPSDPPGFAGPILSVDLSNVNFGSLTVKGTDLQLQYTFPGTAYGQFVSTLAGTYVDEYEILLTPGTRPTNQVGRANDSGYPVRFKSNAGISWSGGEGWSASATARYLASYTDYDGVQRLPSQTWLDVQLGYRFGDQSTARFLRGIETTLGVINLTDKQGDFSNNFNNTTGYDPQQADVRGRFYYLSLKARF